MLSAGQRQLCMLDLFTEFRNHTNGTRPPFGNGLFGALGYFGCDTIDAHYEKREMLELILEAEVLGQRRNVKRF